jgi:hypothetical protein
MMRGIRWALASGAVLLATLTASDMVTAANGGARSVVDAARIQAASAVDWLSYGRTYDEQRFSPLDRINQGNIGTLGLAWSADMDTARGQEATPLVIDGKIYITTAWSKAKAYDAVSGKLLWEFDPKVPGETAVKACCDVVNRGLAAWGDKLYLGTLDGRLIALDRATGRQVWSTVTVDQTKAYTITGAPRVINGLVLIGNGGAEMGVRGYITAYDAQTGKQVWRFYTVPDQPGKNTEEYLKKAESTWHGEWWKLGGGGTVWDRWPMTRPPICSTSAWATAARGTSRTAFAGRRGQPLPVLGRRDPREDRPVRLALPGNAGRNLDFTASQHIMLADLEIGGKVRKVLMHAPKNGFFYVIDRVTGQFISGNNYAPVNWATGLDPVTAGRSRTRIRATTRRQALHQHAGRGGRAFVAPDGLRSRAEAGVHPRAVCRVPLFSDKNWKPSPVGFNVGIDQAASAMPADAKVRAERAPPPPGRSSPGTRWRRRNAGASASPARGTGPAGHRRRPAVPGQRQGHVRGLFDRTAGCGRSRADRRGRGAGHLHGRRRAIRRGAGRLGRRVAAGDRHPRREIRPGAQRQPPAGVQDRRQGQPAAGSGAERTAARSARADRHTGASGGSAQHFGRYCNVCHGDAAIGGAWCPTCAAAASWPIPNRGR